MRIELNLDAQELGRGMASGYDRDQAAFFDAFFTYLFIGCDDSYKLYKDQLRNIVAEMRGRTRKDVICLAELCKLHDEGEEGDPTHSQN